MAVTKRKTCYAVWGDFDIGRLFRANPEGIARFRLGRGVVGNTTYALWAACVAAVGVVYALRESPIIALAALGLIAIVYLTYMFATH